MPRGTLITIEGCEGVGKSSQIRLLGEYCRQHNINAHFVREPGGTPISEAVRRIILDAEHTQMADMTELLLYAAARAQLVKQVITPRINAGQIVVCDRFVDSTVVYQGFGRGMDIATVDHMNALALDGLTIDRTIWLDLHPVDGFARKGGAANGDRLEAEDIEFHQRVYAGYVHLAQRYNRIVRIDASGTKAQTHARVVAAFLECFAR